MGKGSGRSMSVLTTLKTAMLAPMARARMRTATVVKPGSRTEGAQSVFEVLEKNVDAHNTACLPVDFTCLLDAAEVE